jgi:hypothetical protein
MLYTVSEVRPFLDDRLVPPVSNYHNSSCDFVALLNSLRSLDTDLGKSFDLHGLSRGFVDIDVDQVIITATVPVQMRSAYIIKLE